LENREGIQPESMKPLQGRPQPPLPPAPQIETETAEANAGLFSPWNMGILGLMFCLALYILFKFTFNEIWAIVKAVLGLSFVIFIHELGHFLAAKWCGVNVSTFSIGFGPAIPGCQFTWGETNYRLAILPLGGYVQMVGQVDGDESSDDADDPRSYRKKTVGQRMLIISAGVIMNAILAVFCFVACYQGPGRERPAAVVSSVDTRAPAFEDGLPSGADIIEIGGVKNPTFDDLTQKVINSRHGAKVSVTYQDYSKPGAPIISTTIEPRVDEIAGRPMIGIQNPRKLQFIAKRDLSVGGPYYAGTPAAAAKFEYGDVIIGMSGPDDPAKVTPLPEDPRYPAHPQYDYFEFARRVQLLADKKIILRVRRTIDKKTAEYDVDVEPMYRLDLGVVMQMGEVLAVRDDSPAKGVVYPPRQQSDKKLDGDVIEAVSVIDADKKLLVWKDKPAPSEKILDPERLPFELRQWSDRLDLAKVDRKGRMVTLHLIRHSELPGQEKIKIEKKLEWDSNWRFDRAAPISLDAPMPIPELGLAYQIKSIVAKAKDGSPFKEGDVIKNFRYDAESFQQELPEAREALYQVAPFLRPERNTDAQVDWMKKDLKEGQWAHVSFRIFQEPYHFKKFVVKVQRGKETEELDIPISVDKSWPLLERGWLLTGDTRRVKASGPLDAVWLGLVDTNNRMMEIFQNLRGMILGRISVTNLGGPLTIARATYIFAFMDFADFAFFLGLISINLAVVNFLPVPVLDGGHMVFLIYEKLRGQPASEGIRVGATYVGLAMILSLMVFVLYLDISRLFF
jgi:regulator of sigma E protease